MDKARETLVERRPTNEILAAHLPELLSPEEKLIWLLGDLMNAAENFFGYENPKRLGHINSSAIRILDEIVDPLRADLTRLNAKVEELERGRDEARSLVTEANNSLFGSQGKG